ncbi:DUF7551 domain-containing protein [Halegenticoccus soli]|uniref:DUF7551 domain-containing protein n=1 Tax=Halegenticoccus soli TaxID=1985678 RepID=UPI000C6E79F3|nr:hypothetical protein [Halegenticoccus soli]
MVGTTLVEIREHVEALAAETGEYYLVCARYGDRPAPAAGLRFESRSTARAAARATEQYRAALRRYDPRLPHYDVIVCQDAGSGDDANEGAKEGTGSGRRSDAEADSSDAEIDRNDRLPSEPAVGETPSGRRDLVEFCHRVAAAVFETLSENDDDAVESAVMDAYFKLAETLSDPDDLCLCLLESMAGELATRLSPAEQARVLSRAASRLETNARAPAETSVDATLARLRELGILGGYARSPWSVDLEDGTRSVAIRLSGYALSPRDGRLPTLPIVVDLLRRNPAWPPAAVRVAAVEDGWRLRLVLSRSGVEADSHGLASVPIEFEAI